jgi:hypothetical protein
VSIDGAGSAKIRVSKGHSTMVTITCNPARGKAAL